MNIYRDIYKVGSNIIILMIYMDKLNKCIIKISKFKFS